jgi:type IV pilus modification protein PilV
MQGHIPNLRRPRRAETGFSLVELLLVATIMAVGLLGLLAMQVVGISNSSQSRHRGTAALLAHCLLDRMVAEGQMSAGERYSSTFGTTTWVFIDATSTSGHTSTAAENFYYDLNGNAVTAASPNLAYTLSWVRSPRVIGSNIQAMQGFVVNVKWNEAVRNSSGATVVTPKYFSVSRNVRI